MNITQMQGAERSSLSPSGEGGVAPMLGETREAVKPLDRPVRAILLLAGSMRTTALDQATRRSALDLPVRENETLMHHWLDLASEVRAASPGMVMRVVTPKGQVPQNGSGVRPGWASTEEDPSSYRGTAGLLRDLVKDYAPSDLVLVAPARRMVLGSLLWPLRLIEDEEVTVFTCGEEELGLTALRVSALNDARDIGFDDFKEQFLPRLVSAPGRVKVREGAGVESYPVRSGLDYISALRARHGRGSVGRERGREGGREGEAEVEREDVVEGEGEKQESWRPRFLIREKGAEMEVGAQAYDSVLLAGSVVGRGAVLGRCVLGPGAVVPAGARLVDAVLG